MVRVILTRCTGWVITQSCYRIFVKGVIPVYVRILDSRECGKNFAAEVPGFDKLGDDQRKPFGGHLSQHQRRSSSRDGDFRWFQEILMQNIKFEDVKGLNIPRWNTQRRAVGCLPGLPRVRCWQQKPMSMSSRRADWNHGWLNPDGAKVYNEG